MWKRPTPQIQEHDFNHDTNEGPIQTRPKTHQASRRSSYVVAIIASKKYNSTIAQWRICCFPIPQFDSKVHLMNGCILYKIYPKALYLQSWIRTEEASKNALKTKVLHEPNWNFTCIRNIISKHLTIHGMNFTYIGRQLPISNPKRLPSHANHTSFHSWEWEAPLLLHALQYVNGHLPSGIPLYQLHFHLVLFILYRRVT